jgi:RHH-type proline utilization regulon transcriptional repressor/proline dehydrogenase/delta 1-pyrroline-5-carboxylate dehydrogenase
MKFKVKGERLASEDNLCSNINSNLESPAPALHFNDFYRKDEAEVVAYLLEQVRQTPEQSQRIAERARSFVEGLREQKLNSFSIENFLQTYDLNSQEGIVLMCLAEA